MKKNHMPFTISFTIYLAAGIIAVILFATKGSYLSRELAATAAVPDENVTAEQPEISKEPETPPAAPTEEDVITDSLANPSSDSDAATAPNDEPASEEATTDEVGDDGKTYYAFTVNDGVTGVRIHETAERNSKTVSHIDGGRSGYVLEQGDTRSKILTKKGTVGYIYNDYITISEIPRDDFPEEYR